MFSLKLNLFINIFLSIKTEKKAGRIPTPIVSKIPIKIEKINSMKIISIIKNNY